MFKKIVCLMIGLALLSTGIPVLAANNNYSANTVVVSEKGIFNGSDIQVDVTALGDGNLFCVGLNETSKGTTVALAGEHHYKLLDISARSPSDIVKTVQYRHQIFDRGGVVLATLTSTVTGVYSEVGRYCSMSSVTGSFSGTYAQNFSYTSSCSDNIGTINIYFNGVYLDFFQYKITVNGAITQL